MGSYKQRERWSVGGYGRSETQTSFYQLQFQVAYIKKWRQRGLYQKMLIFLPFQRLLHLIQNKLLHSQLQTMETELKSKKYEPHFPVTKIKKIIQQNQQIGKLSNLVPPLIQKSLQYFLIELIQQSEKVATENGVTKLTPAILKHALLGLQSYEFMKDALDDVDDMIVPLGAAKSKSSQKSQKRTKSEVQNKQTAKQQRKGRKRVKAQGCEQSVHSQEEEN